MDEGEQPIEDAEVLAQVRSQARKVLLQAVASALVVTAIILALPETGA